MKRQWIVFSLTALVLASAFAQSDVALAFDVASIHRNGPADQAGSFEFLPSGRFRAENYPLRTIILRAFHIDDFQLSGGPDWLIKERYTIQAKAPDGLFTEEQMRRMLQTLLAERFHLKFHRKRKISPRTFWL